ncbi:MAG: rod shape-determining protein MreC [Novosphingobium sp.]
MAPPNRRSGFSRRAQYNTFFAYVAAVIGGVLGAGLLIVSIVDPSTFSRLRNLGNDATAPVARAGAGVRSSGKGLFETIGGYFAAGSQNADLRRELDAAKVKLIEAQALAEENRRLKALLQLSQENPKPVAMARLIGSTSSSTRRIAVISAGTRDGVAAGMPVRSSLGLVGRVLEVGYSTARVLLITDADSIVPVRRAGDGVPAFAQGRADGTVQVKLVNLGVNPLKLGDTFVTSGSGGLYRPGIAIGIVQSLLRDGAIVRLTSNPAATDYVAVEQVWTPEAVAELQRQEAASRGAGQ